MTKIGGEPNAKIVDELCIFDQNSQNSASNRNGQTTNIIVPYNSIPVRDFADLIGQLPTQLPKKEPFKGPQYMKNETLDTLVRHQASLRSSQKSLNLDNILSKHMSSQNGGMDSQGTVTPQKNLKNAQISDIKQLNAAQASSPGQVDEFNIMQSIEISDIED